MKKIINGQRRRRKKLACPSLYPVSNDYIIKETRTLPSGNIFTRNRCLICHSYWDTNHSNKKHKDEKPFHYGRSNVEHGRFRL